jgi:hypothetical protein
VTLFRPLIWLVAAALAFLVGYASSVIATQVKAPDRAYSHALWRTATSEANFAYASFATRQSTDPKAEVSPGELQLARHAYRTEPLSTPSLGLVIASMTQPRDAEMRGRLLSLAGKLTRRNSAITSASIDAAGRSGDKAAFFVWLSRAVLTNAKLRSTYIGAMADATALEGSVEALTPVLGRNPAWAETYWTVVSARGPSVGNAAELRIAIAEAPWRQVQVNETDRALARRLAAAGQFAVLARLSAAFDTAGRPASDKGNRLLNGNFVRQPLLPPRDWALATSGYLGASIDDRAQQMTISAIAGAHGSAVHQLVELEPGEYDVAWSMDSNASIDPGALSARLVCAEKGAGATMIPPVALVAGSRRSGVVVPEGPCRWHWFSIEAQVPDGSAGFDAVLRRLSLTRRAS